MVYMKFKMKKLIITLIVIFIVLIMFFVGYKLIKKETVYEEREIYLTADEIIDLLLYVPYSMINMESYNDAYYGDVVTSDSILSTILSPSLISGFYDNYAFDDNKSSKFNELLKKNNIEYASIFKKNDIIEYLMKRYNFELDSLSDISDKIKIVELDNTYTAVALTERDNFSILYKYLISVDEAKGTTNSVAIKERSLFCLFKNDKWYIYKNTNISDENNIVKIYDNKNSNGNTLEFSDIDEKIKEDFKDYNYQFKHTYRMNKTGYYWYSTEMLEIKK